MEKIMKKNCITDTEGRSCLILSKYMLIGYSKKSALKYIWRMSISFGFNILFS